jgi:hypothetical protein
MVLASFIPHILDKAELVQSIRNAILYTFIKELVKVTTALTFLGVDSYSKTILFNICTMNLTCSMSGGINLGSKNLSFNSMNLTCNLNWHLRFSGDINLGSKNLPRP